MKKWVIQFIEEQGKRLFFMTIVFFFGGLFIWAGLHIKGEVGAGLAGAGVTNWIQLAAIAMTQAKTQTKVDK